MIILIAEVYDAFREAGALEGKSRAAAEALSLYEERFVGDRPRRFDGIDHTLDLLRADMAQRFEQARVETAQRFDQARADTAQFRADSNLRFDQLRADSNQRSDAARSDLGLRIERVEGRLNLLQWQLAILIGGVVALVIKAFFSGIH